MDNKCLVWVLILKEWMDTFSRQIAGPGWPLAACVNLINDLHYASIVLMHSDFQKICKSRVYRAKNKRYRKCNNIVLKCPSVSSRYITRLYCTSCVRVPLLRHWREIWSSVLTVNHCNFTLSFYSVASCSPHPLPWHKWADRKKEHKHLRWRKRDVIKTQEGGLMIRSEINFQCMEPSDFCVSHFLLKYTFDHGEEV